MKKNIAIAMATYNGEKYIEEQILSIQRQTVKDWKLYIRDDASTDNTLKIIKQLSSNDSRIILIDNPENENVGHCQNFNKILELVYKKNYDWFFLSDQDDYWDSTKIEIQLKDTSDIESPKLISCDMSITDKNLKIINGSYFLSRGLKENLVGKIKTQIIENSITGCTILINRSALKTALPIPKYVYNHDWWLTLCTLSIRGDVAFINRSLVKYRQHENNEVGVGKFSKLKSIQALSKHRKIFKRNILALKILKKRLSDQSVNEQEIDKYISINQGHNKLVKIYMLLKNGFDTHTYSRWVIITLCI